MIALATWHEAAFTARLVRIPLLFGAAAGGALLVWRAGIGGDLGELVLAGSVAIGLSTVFADHAAVTLAASPTTKRERALARLLLVLPIALVCWVIARAVAQHTLPGASSLLLGSSWLPDRDAWLVFATATGLVLGIEGVAARTGAVAGLAGSSAVLVGTLLSFNLPSAVAVFPVEAFWLRWATMLAVATLVLAASLADPGRCGRIARIRPQEAGRTKEGLGHDLRQ